MLLLVIILKGLVEVVLFCHVAQAILFVFAGATRDRNIVYRVFATVNRPIWKATRVVTPRLIVDGHIGFVSFFFLSIAWAALVLAKVYYHVQLTAPAG